MLFDATGILLPANEQMRSLEFDPLLKGGIALRPSRFDTFARNGVDELAVNWLLAIVFAGKACEIGPIIGCEQSDADDDAGYVDQLPEELVDPVAELGRFKISFELIGIRCHTVPALA